MNKDSHYLGKGHCNYCGRDDVPIHDVMGDIICIDCLMENIITEEEELYDEE